MESALASELFLEPSPGFGLPLHGLQQCCVLFLASYPVPATSRAGEGEDWALPTSLASCPVPASSLGYWSSASQADLISGERAKPARQPQHSKPSLTLPCSSGSQKTARDPRFLLLAEDHPTCPPVWKPHNPGFPVPSQIVSSDITFSKGWQHAGCTDVAPACSLVLDFTPGGDSYPSVLG